MKRFSSCPIRQNQSSTWYLRSWTIFLTNFRFNVKKRTTEKYYFLFFINILLALTKFSIWQEELALVYNFITFWDFPDASRPATRVAHTICITDNHAPFHMWQRKNLVKYQKVSKYNDRGCSIKVILYEMSQVTEQGKT